MWRHFTGAPSRVVRNDEEVARIEAQVVADLHDALGRFPRDEPLRALIDELREREPRFAELWGGIPSRATGPPARRSSIPRSGRSRSTATCSPCMAATCA